MSNTDSGFLATATAREATTTTESLREVARVEYAGKVLAVCEASGGTLVLARERTRKGKDGEADTVSMKRTSALADFAHAVESGLLS